jgi:hypothetical protein
MVLNKSNIQILIYNHGSKNGERKQNSHRFFMKSDSYCKVFEISGTGGSLNRAVVKLSQIPAQY